MAHALIYKTNMHFNESQENSKNKINTNYLPSKKDRVIPLLL